MNREAVDEAMEIVYALPPFIRLLSPSKQLDVICRHLKYMFEEGDYSRKFLIKLNQRMIDRYSKPDNPFYNDQRLVRMYAIKAIIEKNRSHLFRSLFLEGRFLRSTYFYVEWAKAYGMTRNKLGVIGVWNLAIAAKAQPIADLRQGFLRTARLAFTEMDETSLFFRGSVIIERAIVLEIAFRLGVPEFDVLRLTPPPSPTFYEKAEATMMNNLRLIAKPGPETSQRTPETQALWDQVVKLLDELAKNPGPPQLIASRLPGPSTQVSGSNEFLGQPPPEFAEDAISGYSGYSGQSTSGFSGHSTSKYSEQSTSKFSGQQHSQIVSPSSANISDDPFFGLVGSSASTVPAWLGQAGPEFWEFSRQRMMRVSVPATTGAADDGEQVQEGEQRRQSRPTKRGPRQKTRSCSDPNYLFSKVRKTDGKRENSPRDD